MRLWVPDGEAGMGLPARFRAIRSNMLLFRVLRVLNQAYYFTLLLLALPSVGLVVRRRTEAMPWATAGLSLIIYFSVISLVFSGQSRFHFSLMPFVAMYSAWTMVRVGRRASGE